MRIDLLSLSLRNFKGAKQVDVPFKERTSIYGDNRTGKTTIFDAFNWLLFGKNSIDVKDFNIKTLQEDNTPFNKLDHSVTGVLSVDGRHEKFQRIYREKWTKKRGETMAEFDGHQSEYFVNDVPVSATDYATAVDAILPEMRFKLLTSPYYFPSLKWETRRSTLFSMAGEITDKELATGVPEFEQLFNSGKALAQQEKEIIAQRKLIKQTLDSIPTRIDELKLNMPDAIDTEAVNEQMNEYRARITELDETIQSENKAYELTNTSIRTRQQKIHQLKQRLSDIEYTEKNKTGKALLDWQNNISQKKNQIQQAEVKIKLGEQGLASTRLKLEGYQKEREVLLEKWNTEDARTYTVPDNELNCPTCKQPLPEGDLETKKSELIANFNTAKRNKLATIEAEGKSIATAIASGQQILNNQQQQIDEQKLILKALQTELSDLELQEPPAVNGATYFESPDYKLVSEEITQLEGITEAVSSPDLTSLQSEKADLTSKITELNRQITLSEQRSKNLERLAQLEKDESKLSQEMADLERTQFTIERFTKHKINTIDKLINSNFNKVKFKLYRTLINGGEEECCDILVNGVPFSDVNHADQINAGIDIINAFSRYYGTSAPVFIDNAEAVTQILPTESQLIRLVVSEADKTLRID